MATPGLVESQQPKPAQPVKPITSEVDAKTETVESRLNDMTSTGSKYTELAKNDAIKQANTRGLINSTMAGAAGVEAGIRASLPIAQQDASTYTDTRFKNQSAQNTFLENRQNANLNKEIATHGSGLTKDEMKVGSKLKVGEMGAQSGLTQDEMRLGSTLKVGEMGAQSELTKSEMILQSGLTKEEQTLLNDLEMKRDAGLSELTMEEQTQLNDLTMKRDTALSGLTREEMDLKTDLEMKRDQGLAELSMEEQKQLSALNIKQQESQSNLDIKRDNNSASLNESIATLENAFKESEIQLEGDLKLTLETTLNDARFSDETKLRLVSSMDKILTEYQQQVTEIGLSDRTASAQAAAMDLAKENRDASLAVYEDLLKTFGDWTWGTDFTPDDTKQTAGGLIDDAIKKAGEFIKRDTTTEEDPSSSSNEDK